ncbi:MAG: patatin-like phospholipase family protein [Candidatus Omnitrophota bacterium]|jgi:NTE family protein
MMDINKEVILNEIPLFTNLTPFQRNIIKNNSVIQEFKKGQVIYEEGSPPNALYCLILGRVEIYVQDESGTKKILEYLHRGKYFGMISLLTNEPHSVTAKAINDCALLMIKKGDFDSIIRKIPALAIDLSRTLSRRLKRKDTHRKSIFESTVLSVFSSYSQAGKTVYALNIALSLKKETHKSVIILDIAPFDKTHTLPLRLGITEPRVFRLFGPDADNPRGIVDFILRDNSGIDLACFHYQGEDERCIGVFIELLSQLVNDYHYIVLDLSSSMDKVIFSILNQSDLIQLLTSPDPLDLNSTHKLVKRLENEFNFNPEKIKIIINEYKLSRLSHEEQVEVLDRGVFATLPKIDFESGGRLVLDDPDCEYSKAVRRIARTLGDTLVGLVLGVGVGYGFCHIGVLKVIEEEKIPIDVIAGSSMGAIIAALWVTGKSSAEILEITAEFSEPKSIWGLVDFTFPRLGFLKGDKLQRFLKKHLGNKTFYDVTLPLKVIASDIKRKEPRVFDRGLLVDAIMASCAMPGVFMPFKFKNELLVDGGIINPLPTEPLIKMGVKKIIAVNVTPSRNDIMRQYTKIKEEITTALPQELKKRRWFSFKEQIKNAFKSNILDLIFSSVEILQSEVALKEALLADVVLHPDTSGLNWLQLHRSKEFAKRGEEEARRNLDKIMQVINE